MLWQLPPVIHHQTMLSVDTAALPWHVADFAIDKLLWPLATQPVIVGLIDTGVSQTHVERGELAGQVLHAADFTNSRFTWTDRNGHGSHTGGIIAARSFGIGRNCVKLVSAKALGDNGTGSDDGIARSIRWCLEKGATILNLSLGSPQPSPTINRELEEAARRGVMCVCAAGNDGGPVNQPAAQEFCLAITAIDRQRELAGFSSRGNEADAAAPGVEIQSLAPGGAFAVMSGTSMACPWVAAYLAVKRAYDLARGVKPIASVAEAIEWLTRDSTDLGKPGRDPLYGVGLPDPAKFAESAEVPHPVGESVGLELVLGGVKWAGKVAKV